MSLGLGGLLILFVGLVMMAQARGKLAAYRRLRQPRVRIAELPPGVWGTFEGTVQPSEHGILRSPVTGREGVVYRIGIFERTSGEGRRWERMHNEQGNADFYLVDDAGSWVRVRPVEASFSLQEEELHGGSGFYEMPPHLEAWVKAVYGSVAPNMRVIERLIPVGTRLILHGQLIPHDGQLWTYTRPGLGQRLLIADPPSVQPGGGMLTNLKAGIVMTVIGIAAIVGAVIVGVVTA